MFALSFSSRASFDPSHDLYSDHILVELLIMHEQLIEQLHRKGSKGITALNQSRALIDRHEQTATRLRAHLKGLVRMPLAAIPILVTVNQP